uniref:Metacaspase-1-like n=1 Tax=Ananas comosus var. bracteatus TaxID=296719 RepID=A0A6V7QRL1_ANACO
MESRNTRTVQCSYCRKEQAVPPGARGTVWCTFCNGSIRVRRGPRASSSRSWPTSPAASPRRYPATRGRARSAQDTDEGERVCGDAVAGAGLLGGGLTGVPLLRARGAEAGRERRREGRLRRGALPLDFEENGVILDDEINATIVRPLPRNVKLHAVVDACHSGTILDLPYLCRLSRYKLSFFRGFRTGSYQWEDHSPPSGEYKGTSGGLAILISVATIIKHLRTLLRSRVRHRPGQ